MNEHVYEITRVENEAWIRMLGVGVRVVIMRAGTFVDLQKQIEAILGVDASALFYEAGIRAGRESTRVLLEEWEERGMDFLKRWGRFYQSAGVGWFKLEDINIDFEKENGYLRVKQSFIAEEYSKSNQPVCHFLCGFFSGVLQEVLGEKVTCEEVKCTAKGDQYCEFKFRKY